MTSWIWTGRSGYGDAPAQHMMATRAALTSKVDHVVLRQRDGVRKDLAVRKGGREAPRRLGDVVHGQLLHDIPIMRRGRLGGKGLTSCSTMTMER